MMSWSIQILFFVLIDTFPKKDTYLSTKQKNVFIQKDDNDGPHSSSLIFIKMNENTVRQNTANVCKNYKYKVVRMFYQHSLYCGLAHFVATKMSAVLRPWRHENKLSDCFGKSMTYSMFTFPRTPDANVFVINWIVAKKFLRLHFNYIFQQFHEIFLIH